MGRAGLDGRMITLAFAGGMLPPFPSSGPGAGNSRIIASVIAGRQTLALFLTLLTIRVTYPLSDDLAVHFAPRAWLARLLHCSRCQPQLRRSDNDGSGAGDQAGCPDPE